jgi:hypothetical protein
VIVFRISDQADDDLTEYLIDHAYRMMLAATTREDQLHWCARMGHYIGQRSPAKVAEMEAAKGLG